MVTFYQSTDHPGDTPAPAVYSRALARPIGACVAPVMVGAAAAALQGNPVWGYLLYGLPSAIAVATLWTQFWLMRTTAEIGLRSGQAAVQSVHDIMYGRSPDWQALHYVRVGRWEVELSVGWRTYTCRPENWPKYEELRSAAEQAFQSSHSSPPAT